MGNHDAGHAMVAVATALINVRSKTGQGALEILDIACNDFQGCDAEFDDSANSDKPFGRLITEAFSPGFDHSKDEYGDNWDEEVYQLFRKRYGLW